jgi:hypothetical protein
MRELHVHFFGCSFTAGDELSDEKWFPWKFTENHTVESFYKKRRSIVDWDWKLYREENKNLAYPKLIMDADPDIHTYSHSENGKSQRHNVFDVLQLVEQKNKVDCIYFQISPPYREMVFNQYGKYDIQYGNPLHNTESSYIRNKLELAIDENQTIQDAMDMYLLDAYLKLKGIPFYFLNITEALGNRNNELTKAKTESIFDFNFLSLKKLPNIIDINYLIDPKDRLLGSHLSKEQHQLVANYILNHINEQFK